MAAPARIFHGVCFLALLASSPLSTLAATNEGDQVVIVYNSRVPGSQGVAEHYAQKRKVPANHIFGFTLTTNEEISRLEFRDELQRPLSKALEKEKLWHIGLSHVPLGTNGGLRTVFTVDKTEIRYCVLCYGVPLRIAEDSTVKEERNEKLRPDQRGLTRNTAAVDSELALLPLMDVKMNLGGWVPNWTYGATNSANLSPTNGILLVTRLDGPNLEVARGLVDKAMQAERDGLWGRAYFDLRNISDPGYKVGDDWIRGASENARRAGFETIVDEKPELFPAGFPMSQIAIYIGWSSGNVEGPLAQSKVEFMPGAIAYHLHSNSGASLRLTNQFWAGPFLARGVTATMGCVNEPYLPLTPDVATFTTALFFRGFSFGEAAYAGQTALSWQTTVVGDPLYRPFGGSPEDLHKRLEEEHSKMLEWSYLRLFNLGLMSRKPTTEVAQLLENVEISKQSAVLQEKLGDIYTAAPANRLQPIDAYQPSRQTRPFAHAKTPPPVHARRKANCRGRRAAPMPPCRSFLHEFPDYPDKVAILHKLLPIARKLTKTSRS